MSLLYLNSILLLFIKFCMQYVIVLHKNGSSGDEGKAIIHIETHTHYSKQIVDLNYNKKGI